MSTATQTNQVSNVQDQSAEATTKIRSILGLSGLSTAELKRLSAALSIAAAEEIASNRTFASRVKDLFTSLAPKKEIVSKSKKKIVTIEDDGLVPITTGINFDFNPLAPPDPDFLVKLYGVQQLPKALNRYGTPRLKEVVKTLVTTKSAPKLKSKATRDDIINYIVSQVAQ